MRWGNDLLHFENGQAEQDGLDNHYFKARGNRTQFKTGKRGKKTEKACGYKVGYFFSLSFFLIPI